MQTALNIRAARLRPFLTRFGQDRRVAAIRGAIERFGAPTISLAVLAAALLALRGIDFRGALALVPRQPLFWLVLAATFVTPVLADWAIYRRIWGLPIGGIAPLTRKLIGNELIVGYLGDAYLYAWARQRRLVGTSAIGQMKDVAILSAAASNSSTIVFALIAAPFAGMLGLHIPLWAAIGCGLVILTPAIVATTFRKSLFRLGWPDLRFILVTHAVRAMATPLLLATLWHLALPTVSLQWWVLFAAMKLVLSRLPFMSNKDLVLAGAAAMLFGRHTDVATLLTMIATLMTLCYVGVGVSLAARDAIARMLAGPSGDADAPSLVALSN